MIQDLALITVPLVLVASALGHLLRPYGLPAALRAHRTLPAALIVPVAGVVVLAELVLGLLTVVVARPALAGAAVLLISYVLYGSYVLRTRPSVPCGCGGAETPLTGWVVIRAAALAVLALAGAGFAGPLPHGSDLAITALAGTTFAVLLWALPRALTVPGRTS
jgi:Methylamine utilisation protein MauE